MEEPTRTRSTYTVTSKTRVLLAIAAINILGPFVDWFTMSSSTAYAIGVMALGIAILVACIIWVHIDADQKGIQLGHGFRIWMVLLMPVALIYYFYRSRGFKYGSLTLLKAIGFYLVTGLIGGIAAVILSLIDGTFWHAVYE